MKYRKLKGYKYQITETEAIQTDLPNTSGNDYVCICNGFIIIEKFYCWDGSSSIAIDTKACMLASLAHDAKYQLFREGFLDAGLHRAMTDLEYYDDCVKAGMWKMMADWRYWAIRKFAGKAAKKSKNPRGKTIEI